MIFTEAVIVEGDENHYSSMPSKNYRGSVSKYERSDIYVVAIYFTRKNPRKTKFGKAKNSLAEKRNEVVKYFPFRRK